MSRSIGERSTFTLYSSRKSGKSGRLDGLGKVSGILQPPRTLFAKLCLCDSLAVLFPLDQPCDQCQFTTSDVTLGIKPRALSRNPCV